MDSHLKVYDLDDQSATFGHVLGDFSAGALESWATRFSSNYGREGKIPQIATTTQSGAVHIWQVEESGDQSASSKLKATRDKAQTHQTTSHKFAMSLDWSRSRDLLAVGGVDGAVSIFSLKGAKPHTVSTCLRLTYRPLTLVAGERAHDARAQRVLRARRQDGAERE